MAVSKSYILIDFENVQPTTLAQFDGGRHHVLLFVGPRQSKLSIQLSRDIHRLRESARYIQAQSGGKNALDFFICFHAGRLAASEPTAEIIVVSKDSGFDPLITQLAEEGVQIKRLPSVNDIDLPTQTRSRDAVPRTERAQKARAAMPSGQDSRRAEEVRQNFAKRGGGRPKTLEKLKNTIGAFFLDGLPDNQCDSIIEILRTEGFLVLTNETVSYPDLELSPLTLVRRQ